MLLKAGALHPSPKILGGCGCGENVTLPFWLDTGIPSLDQNVRLDDGDNSGYVCIVTVVIIITLAMYNSIIHYYTYGVLIDIEISINSNAAR